MSDTRLIGSGTVRDCQWALEAGGDDNAYWTGLEVNGPNDYRCSAGMAGPKLWGEHLINAYTARNTNGPLSIVVRASPEVARVVVRGATGDEAELRPYMPMITDKRLDDSGSTEPLPSTLNALQGRPSLRSLQVTSGFLYLPAQRRFLRILLLPRQAPAPN